MILLIWSDDQVSCNQQNLITTLLNSAFWFFDYYGLKLQFKGADFFPKN